MANTASNKNPLQSFADQQSQKEQSVRETKDNGFISLYGYQPDTHKLNEITSQLFAALQQKYV